jgi:DNA-directed RNA polymerase subunit L
MYYIKETLNTMFSNIKSDGRSISFDVQDVDVSLVNAIRRAILADVPTVAFAFDPNKSDNDIVIHTNTGALHNEFFAHRLSLVPLFLNKNEIESFDPRNYKFLLHKKNDGNQMMDITTKDIDVLDETGNKNKALRDRLFPPNSITKDYILLTRLKPNLYESQHGDEIKLEAIASKGVGSQHSRWCPVSKCCFYNIVDEDKATEALNSLLEKTPEDKKEETKKRFELLDMARYFKKNEYDEPSAFHFELESECGLSCKEIFAMGITEVIKRVEELRDNLDNEQKVSIYQQGAMFFFDIKKEGHTLGNLIQAGFYNHLVRTKQPVLQYVGYYQPHPLESHIILKVRMASMDDSSIIKVVETTKMGCQKIIDDLQYIANEWSHAK